MSIAMTFDDGPSVATTPKLLDLLDKLSLTATFFVLGKNAQAHAAVLKRVAGRHEIASHSWDHPRFCSLTDDQIRKQLADTQKAIQDGAGVTPTLMRPPYGDISAKQKELITAEFGYKIVGWDVDPEDWRATKTPANIADHILAKTKDGNTVLAHDIHQRTIDAMALLLPELKKKFKLATVSALGKFTQGALGASRCGPR